MGVKGQIPWNKGTRDKEKARERRRRYETKPEVRAARLARQAKRRKENGGDRDWRLQKYGLSRADYDKLVAAQGRACAICFRPAEDGQWKKLKVDHNHATGTIRGLLCHHCNVALGHFGDDQRLLDNAKDYLTNDGAWIEGVLG